MAFKRVENKFKEKLQKVLYFKNKVRHLQPLRKRGAEGNEEREATLNYGF